MNSTHKKRAALEPVIALLDDAERPDPLKKRPVTTTLGAILVFLRGFSGALFVVFIVLMWQYIEPQLANDPEILLDPDDSYLLYLVFVGVSAVTVIGLLLLVFLVWRGSNLARITVMCWVTLSTIIAAIGYFTLGEKITLQTSLVLVALDVLILLALSSKDSRAWSQMTRAERKTVLQQRKTVHTG